MATATDSFPTAPPFPSRFTRRRELPIAVYDKQAKFLQSRAWLRGFVAGRGGGKTRIGAVEVLATSRANDPWMSVSPTYNIIHDTTYATFREVAEETGQWVRGRLNPTPQAWFRTVDGGIASIVFKSGEDPEKLRGPSKIGLWIDEASITVRGVFDIGSAVLRHRGRMGRIILTFTPKGKRHWTFEAFYDRIEEDGIIRAKGGKSHRVQSIDQDGSGDHWALLEGVETGELDARRTTYFDGVPFVHRAKTELIHAHTLENPFLPAEFYETIAGNYTSTLAAQELAGRFVDLLGLMFFREWFFDKFVTEVPRDALRVRYWDRASTEAFENKNASYSAGILIAKTQDGRYFVEDVVRGQWSPRDRNQWILETAKADAAKYNNSVQIFIEQEGGSGGKEISQQTAVMLAAFPFHRDIISGKQARIVDKLSLPGEAKIVRAMPFAAACENGLVHIKRGPWNDDFLAELTAFPEYVFADQVDAASGAYNRLANWTTVSAVPTRTVVEQSKIEHAERFGVKLIESRRRRLGR